MPSGRRALAELLRPAPRLGLLAMVERDAHLCTVPDRRLELGTTGRIYDRTNEINRGSV